MKQSDEHLSLPTRYRKKAGDQGHKVKSSIEEAYA